MAQSPPEDAANPAAPPVAASDAALPERQRELQQRLARLESQMLKLAKLLAESEPAKAQRLREALRVHGERELIRRLEETVEQLKQGELGDADVSQQALIRDLQEVLKEIADDASAVDEKRAERERVLELRRQVEALRAGQLENLQRTRAAQRAAAFADRLSREAEELRKALDRASPKQQADGAKSANAENTAKSEQGEGAKSQRSEAGEGEPKPLPDVAREAAERLREAQAEAPDERANRAVDEARKELQSAGAAPNSSENSQKQSGAESGQKQSGQQQSGQQQNSQQQNSEQPGGEQQQQSGEEKSAENGGNPQSAPAQPQDETREKIERAIRRLNDEARRLRQADQTRALEQAERALEADARAAQDAQESQGKQQSGKPGKERLQKAREKMQKAADELSEQDVDESETQQREALDELQQTIEELEDALRQTRQDEMEETLGALEAKLKALVARAERGRESLAPLAKLRGPALEDRETLRSLAGVADEVAAMRSDTADIRRLLVDEGTTVLLPELLEQVATDLSAGEKSLRAKSPSAGMSALESAIAALREVLDAVVQRRDEMQKQEQEGQQMGGGNKAIQALLPGSTELKLLRSAQARVHAETAELSGIADPTGEIYAALAERQAKLIDLARKMQQQ
ncbi:MAG: hypothetical protein SF069_03685 [Phycisphaerae bacterium]|nr:hypothetical protein [Phycisphaerae bacterium]